MRSFSFYLSNRNVYCYAIYSFVFFPVSSMHSHLEYDCDKPFLLIGNKKLQLYLFTMKKKTENNILTIFFRNLSVRMKQPVKTYGMNTFNAITCRFKCRISFSKYLMLNILLLLYIKSFDSKDGILLWTYRSLTKFLRDTRFLR